MTEQRANEIYALSKATPGTMGAGEPFDTFMTDEEKKAVQERWSTMCGTSCWNDAFYSFMSKEKLPPYMRARFAKPQEKWEEV